jgi:type IV secretory pathway VirB10-like protein
MRHMVRAAPHRVGLIVGVLVLWAGLGSPASPQQAAEPGAVQRNQPGAANTPAAVKTAKAKSAKAKTAKPATKPAPVGSVDMRVPQTGQWTLEDALPSRTRKREAPAESSRSPGRVPVEGGTLGFSTETKLDAHRTSDGNRIRGLDRGQPDASYLGLSLSVTTDDRTFLPRTILPNW